MAKNKEKNIAKVDEEIVDESTEMDDVDEALDKEEAEENDGVLKRADFDPKLKNEKKEKNESKKWTIKVEVIQNRGGFKKGDVRFITPAVYEYYKTWLKKI